MSEANVVLTASDVEAKLLRGPYHQWLGLKVKSVGEGEIILTATWREEWVVNPDIGYTHGGVLAGPGQQLVHLHGTEQVEIAAARYDTGVGRAKQLDLDR